MISFVPCMVPIHHGRMQNFTNQNPSKLTPADLSSTASTYGLTAAHLSAIAAIEGSGAGYLPDGRPKILLEAHIFSRLTGHKYDQSHPGISSPVWNRSLYKGGAGEYPRLAEALALDEGAVLSSASWGLFQVMGSNFGVAGYGSVQDMVRDHVAGGEPAHLKALMRFLASNRLIDALKKGDWASFARGYNGAGYAANSYDQKLAVAFAKAGGR